MESLVRDYLGQYLAILIFIGVGLALAVMIVLVSFIAARQKPDSEKLSPYECGFEPFADARSKFGT